MTNRKHKFILTEPDFFDWHNVPYHAWKVYWDAKRRYQQSVNTLTLPRHRSKTFDYCPTTIFDIPGNIGIGSFLSKCKNNKCLSTRVVVYGNTRLAICPDCGEDYRLRERDLASDPLTRELN